MKKLKYPPSEAGWAYTIMYTGGPVGLSIAKEVDRIIRKYPEWFQYEHVMDKIPEHVHEAFRAEAYGVKANQLNELLTCEGGYVGQIQNLEPRTYNPGAFTLEMFEEFLQVIEHKEIDKQKEKEGITKIFNKHYKKYGLKPRFNMNGQLY